MIQHAIEKYLQSHNFDKINLKAIFFDMDGVLFDSMTYHAKAWAQAMSENGIIFSEYDAYLNEGQPGVETIRIAFEQQKGRPATQEECKNIYQRKGEIFSELGANNLQKIDFAYEMVELTIDSGLNVFVVTGSAHKDLLQRLLTHFPMIESENVISALDVKKGKPSPEPYLKALEKSELQPYEAIVIENAPLGVQSASAAQIFTLAVNTGLLEDSILLENGANVVFESMEHLYKNWNKLQF